jgi:hypothetical protein
MGAKVKNFINAPFLSDESSMVLPALTPANRFNKKARLTGGLSLFSVF